MPTKTCSLCGKTFTGFSMIMNNKLVCPDCYNHEIERLEKVGEERDILLKYIKDLFSCECPTEVVSLIDKPGNKKLKGIKATIYYYYEILENSHTAADVQFLYYNKNENYEKAKAYFHERELLREKNMTVDITPVVNTVVIKKESVKNRRRPLTKMEDL